MAYSRAGTFTYQEIDTFFNRNEEEDYDYQDTPYYEVYGGALAGQWTSRRRPDPIVIVAIALVVFIAIGIWLDKDETVAISAAPPISAVAEQPITTAVPPPPPQPTVAPVSAGDPAAIIAPYDDFILTQGLHGQSYGHLAIDIKAGKGAVIKSPIEGVVTALFTDEIGNPTIVVENDVYQVMMLHGVYTVALGDHVKLGQPVGTESNLGNTRDAWGNSCRNRDCGYHTHLNIFDKRLGTNVNPLEVLDLRLGP